MPRNKPYYLKYYREWMKAGRLPKKGLCNSTKYRDRVLLNLFAPYDNKWRNLFYWGFNGNLKIDHGHDTQERRYSFSPIRQTIVLLMAAMNNEL